MKSNKMEIRRGFRKLVLDSGVWQYCIGKTGFVVIFSPTMYRYLTNQSVLTGISWNDLERLCWKNSGYDHPGNLKPSHIKLYIESTLLGN